MALRRGFKAEANRWARDLREELNIAPAEPLCPRLLCNHLDLPLIPLSTIDADSSCINFFIGGAGAYEFSAVTLVDRGRRWIVYNDGHEQRRQASDIAHEVAHALLRHPVSALYDEQGVRAHDAILEEEANWLGPALLISEEAALYIARSGMPIDQAMEVYGATRDVIQMRINVSGARKRVA